MSQWNFLSGDFMIKHILNDGTVMKDIKGHVVKMDDAKVVYSILGRINERRNKEKNDQQIRA